MKRKSSGATCKVCQERLRNPIDTMPRAVSARWRDQACIWLVRGQNAELIAHTYSQDLEKDVWATADGGVGSSDSEDEAIHEDLAAKRDVGDKALQSAYQVLEARPKGSKPVVICDSSDDDD
ncbi:hypothetical protein JCM10908_001594 [Rhodotorula pacifica]|uniref:uncharacterized protein n=1 Tax=Rhodotorula pacifica TaxID=1495444 RepID=UPI0031728B0D